MTLERRRLLVAGIAYLAVGLWVASFFGTWSDEEYTLATTAHGPAFAWQRAITYELQAPLYFVVLSVWREIDSSVWFARLFSVLCATALFFVLAKVGKRVVPGRDPLPFALLASLNPFVVVAALQIRLYALALLIAAVLWLCYDYGFANGSSKRARFAFVAVAVAGIYVQYFLGFLLVGFGLALLIAGKLKGVGNYALHAGAVAIAALPLLSVARSQARGYVPVTASHFSIVYLTSLHPWLEFLIPHLYRTVAETPFEHVLYFSLAVGMGLCWVWCQPNPSRKLFATVAVAAGVEFTYIAVAVGVQQRLNDRYFIALFVPCAVAVYALLRSSTANPPVPQRVLVTMIGVMTVASLVSQYRFLAQNGDWIRVASYLQDRAKPGDVIAIYTSDNLPAFERQYRGNVRVVPFPRPNPTDRYVITAVDVDSPAEAMAVFRSLEPYKTLWLVDSVRCFDDPPMYGCDDLHDAVAQNFTSVDRKQFYMNSVSALTRRTDTAAQPK